MNDEMIRSAAKQQAVQMEKDVAAQQTQLRSQSLEDRVSGKQAAIDNCLTKYTEKLDKQSDRLAGSLQQAKERDNPSEVAAEQWRQESRECLSGAADRANRLIRDMLSEVADRNSSYQQEALNRVAEVARAVQACARQLDEQGRSLCNEIDRALYEGEDRDRLQEALSDSRNDLQRTKDEFDGDLDQIAGRALVADVAANGEEERVAEVREASRDDVLKRISEGMASGLPDADGRLFIEDRGLDSAVDLGEKWKSKDEDDRIGLSDVRAQVHHSTSIKESPEFALRPDAHELLATEAHIEGAHGGDFNKERNGQAADPKFDQHVPFNMPRSLGTLGPGEDLDAKVDNASEHEPHEAEDRMIESLDAKRGEERREADWDAARRRQLLIADLHQEQEQQQEARTTERDRGAGRTQREGQEVSGEAPGREQMEGEQQELRRLEEERSARLREEERKAEERSVQEHRRQQQEAERAVEQRRQQQQEAERREDDRRRERQEAQRTADERRRQQHEAERVEEERRRQQQEAERRARENRESE